MTTGQERFGKDELPMMERVVRISRVAQVAKGGRHLSFQALVVVGDGAGHVGVGMGKADAVPDAVKKGAVDARKNLISVHLKGGTVPHEVTASFGASEVLIKPAPPGTGVIAGGSVRAVVELAGVKDVVTKARGSTNPINTVKAAFNAITMLKDPEAELARRRQLAEAGASRGKERPRHQRS